MKLMEHFLPKPVKYIRITEEGREIVTIPKGPVELHEYEDNINELQRELGREIYFPLCSIEEERKINDGEQGLLWLTFQYLVKGLS